jgi:hypothetical protein
VTIPVGWRLKALKQYVDRRFTGVEKSTAVALIEAERAMAAFSESVHRDEEAFAGI